MRSQETTQPNKFSISAATVAVSSSRKNVQQLIVETYLHYRQMFFQLKMLSHREYILSIRCISIKKDQYAFKSHTKSN